MNSLSNIRKASTSSDYLNKEQIGNSLKSAGLICLVCGAPASGFNFSVITCMCCKAFFRRNALCGLKSYQCRYSNEQCSINRITRRDCSYCRLKKCFQVGMKKESILTDDMKRIKQEKLSANRQLTVNLLLQKNYLNENDSIHLRNISNIYEEYCRSSIMSYEKHEYEFVCHQPIKSRFKIQYYFESFQKHNLSLNNFYLRLPELQQFSDDEQNLLLQNNTRFLMRLNSVETRNDSFPLWGAVNRLVEIMYGKSLVEDVDQCLYQFKHHLNDSQCTQLILIILLFSTSIKYHGNLNTLTIYRIQEKYTTLLWSYLEKRHGYAIACQKFSLIIRYCLRLQMISHSMEFSYDFMNALCALHHFCDLHGPQTLVCTEGRTYIHDFNDNDNEDLKTYYSRYINAEHVQEKAQCKSCTLSNERVLLTTVDYSHHMQYISSSSIPNAETFKNIRQTCIRSLTSEKPIENDHPVLFGDDEDGYCLSFNFVCKDFYARGSQRRYSLCYLYHDKYHLLSLVNFINKCMKQIIYWLQYDANQTYDEEGKIKVTTKVNGIIEASYICRTLPCQSTDRMLCDIVRDSKLIYRIHSLFVWILRTTNSAIQESLFEALPTEERRDMIESQSETINESTTTTDNYHYLESSLNNDEDDYDSLEYHFSSYGHQALRLFDSFIKKLNNIDDLQYILFHWLIGNQLIIKYENRTENKDYIRAFASVFRLLSSNRNNQSNSIMYSESYSIRFEYIRNNNRQLSIEY
ncbi:hypothetical protein I4U23_026479 [Adineta vaga]|nr:hypothetical protein I4U23_026479 [Adineta vaga]